MAAMLKSGASSGENGIRTQAPTNTGAGWYTLATGAWPAVPFHQQYLPCNGASFSSRKAAFDAGFCRLSRLPRLLSAVVKGGADRMVGRPERCHRRAHRGLPSLSVRKGCSDNYIDPADIPSFIASFGLQFDHPAGYAGQALCPRPALTGRGWTNIPLSFSRRWKCTCVCWITAR